METTLWRTIKKCFEKVTKFFKKGNGKVSVAIKPKEVDELKTALLEVAPKVVTRSVPFSTVQLNVTRSKAFSTATLNATRSLTLSTATETSAPSALEFMTQTLELASLNVPSCIEASQLATLEADCCSEQCAITSTTKVPEQTCSSNLPSEKQHTRPCSPPAMQSRMRKIRSNRRMTLAIQPDLSVILGNQ